MLLSRALMPLASMAAGVAQQTASFAYFSVRAMIDPTDADAVSAVGELTAVPALERLKNTMMGDRVGRQILKERPLVRDDVLEMASRLPPNTFGAHYANYMNFNHFTPDGRTDVTYIADPTLAYIMTRYRQCHDFLHTCADCGRTVEEEVALKLLEWTHTGLPLGFLAMAGGSPHLTTEQCRNYSFYRQWARENAPRNLHGQPVIPCYLNIPWEKLLERDHEEVLRLTGITPLHIFMKKHKGAARKTDPSDRILC